MAPHAGRTCYQHYSHGEGPALPGPGYTFPGPATSHPSGSMSIPTFWDLMPSQLLLSAPDGRPSASSQMMPDYDIHRIDQPLQPGLHFLPSINIYHCPVEDHDGQLATDPFKYASSTFITGMDETVIHQSCPLRFNAVPYPSACPDRQITGSRLLHRMLSSCYG